MDKFRDKERNARPANNTNPGSSNPANNTSTIFPGLLRLTYQLAAYAVP